MKTALRVIITIVFLLLLMWLCSSCKSNKTVSEVPVLIEGVKIDSTSTNVKSDFKLVVADTLIVTLSDKGDTLLVKDSHWRRETRDSIQTVYICRIDSIPYPVYLTKTVTRAEVPPFMWWTTTILAFTTIGLITAIWLIRKRSKQEPCR